MNSNNKNGKIPEDAEKILKQKGINTEDLKNADKNALLKNLSSEDRAKINALLNDKESLNKILNSDKAKAIMNAFFGKK